MTANGMRPGLLSAPALLVALILCGRASAADLVTVPNPHPEMSPACVDRDRLWVDDKGYTHVWLTSPDCATVTKLGLTPWDALALNCPAVRKAPRDPDGTIAAGYFYRLFPHDPWKWSEEIGINHASVALFVCRR